MADATRNDIGASEELTRRDQPAFDWTGDLGLRRQRDGRSASTRRDGPMPRAATAPLTEVKSAGSHRSLPRRPTSAFWLDSSDVRAAEFIAGPATS